MAKRIAPSAPHPLDFYARLRWLDGKPLLDTMEDYRKRLHQAALYTFRDDGAPLYNFVLSGRAKKNWKSTDLTLAAFYRVLMWDSLHGSDALILANDEEQAGDDLALAKKLVAANPDTLGREVNILSKSIIRKDKGGEIRILPSQDVKGLHGKTAGFLGLDEIHSYRNYDVFEALAPDPTREVLIWCTSYDTIYNSPGVPLFDFKAAGLRGDDPRMLFSWYSGDLCTDPAFAELPPEQRANPSMDSWPEGPAYLEQQRRRLPNHKFRRLHLNLPGAPNSAFLDGDSVSNAIVRGLKRIPPQDGRAYVAFVDMSGGSSDDACLGIAHYENGRRLLDCLISQDGRPPFDPRAAVRKFVRALREYGVTKVMGDRYAGETFKRDFEAQDIDYVVSDKTKTEIYEAFEPTLNAGECELLDVPKLEEQLLTLVIRGASIDHQPGGHDDWSNAAAGAIGLATKDAAEKAISREERMERHREHMRRQDDPYAVFGADPLSSF
jgi:phage terminase large subunit-like protein